jgi:hypothetical protein
MTLGALLAAVAVVDVLMAWQPAMFVALSEGWRRTVGVRHIAEPSTHALAAAAALLTMVISSVGLAAFARITRLAPHISLAPAWVALCTLSASRLSAAVPLPLPIPAFAALSALLFVGAGAAFRAESRGAAWLACLLSVAPLLALVAGYASAVDGPRAALYPFTRDVALLFGELVACPLGVASIVRFARSERSAREVDGLEGIDVVEELFVQVERAERSEARVAQLERQLQALTGPTQLRRVR